MEARRQGWTGRTAGPGNGNGSESIPLPPGMARFAERAARNADPVLLYGETGCGKSFLARRIHALGGRSAGPFVPVNCAAVPPALFEREMFGHVRGAFTDAKDSRPGFFEEASGGTLFLDELGELPRELQPKLLAVLDDGTIRRLGSTREVRVRFRLVAATNRDLAAMVAQNAFRSDLYYRCAVLEYRVPPLRERRDELPVIVRALLARLAGPTRVPVEITEAAMDRLVAYGWPGNIRELDNALRYATFRASDEPILPRHLPARVQRGGSGLVASPAPVGSGDDVAACRPARYTAPANPAEEVEMIREALRLEGYNRTRAARRLGMSRATLWTKLHRYGIL